MLLIPASASEKALLIYGKESKLEFDLAFRNRLFCFDPNLSEYNKQMDQLDKDDDTNTWSEAAKREKALSASHSIRPIANCTPTALYYQKNEITDEAWYYFWVDFPHDGASIKNTFTSAQITSAAEFKKRMLGIRRARCLVVLARVYTTEWVNLLWQAFGAKGMVALTFWFGVLFAEQIRTAQSVHPFLEVVGKAGGR